MTDLIPLSGIYVITHTATGRKYVGQSLNVDARTASYKYSGHAEIGRAIKTHGLDAFTIEVVERVSNEQLLNERELHWIRKLNTVMPHGFNCQPKSRIHSTEATHAELTLKQVMDQHNLTRADVARLLGLEVRRHSHGTIDAWLSGRRNMPPAKLELLRMKLQADHLQKHPITEVHIGARRTIYAEPTASTDNAR